MLVAQIDEQLLKWRYLAGHVQPEQVLCILTNVNCGNDMIELRW